MNNKWEIDINSGHSCCNGYKTIVGILKNNLFQDNPNNVLEERYKQMISLVDCSYNNWGNCARFNVLQTKDTLLEIPTNCFRGLQTCQNYNDLGHDLPYWIEVPKEKERGRIMLVSQDPLRNNRGPGVITLSSPFGMHSLDYRGNRIMTQMVKMLLDNGYSVYLTDFNKLYGKNPNKPVDFSGMREDFIDILKSEICFWNPTKIIAVGRVAEEALKAIKGVTCITGAMPHPNARLSKVTKLNKLEEAAGLKGEGHLMMSPDLPM